MMSLGAFSALADDDVTIPAGKKAKAGTSLEKMDGKADPELDVYKITPGSSIRFWIYRNGKAQVSPTYKCKVQNDIPIRYNNSGNKKQGALYHSVWRKDTQSINGTSVYVHFAFVP